MVFSLKRSVYGISLLFFFQSCSYYVSPTTVPTAFKEVNDKSIAVSASTQGLFANLAFSPVEHLYVVANGGLAEQSYNYAAGIGGYLLANENITLEFNTTYGLGEFNWGDPFNGLSDPSQINYANGDLRQLSSMFAVNYHFTKKHKLSFALAHRLLDVNFESSTFDGRLPGNQRISRARFNMIGGHLLFRQNIINGRCFLFYGLGVETSDASNLVYTNNPIFLRIGLELR